jgi:ubiquinone/menaquinone biosynthesis C-methylase UbiE
MGAFMDEIGAQTLLLCGAGVSGTEPNEGIVERLIASKAREVLAFDVYDRGPQPWPFIVADGRDMPFASQSYDLIVANAVIEHVGDKGDQQNFVRDHMRVAKAFVITTPNKWFPVEAHTSAVFRHWSPSWRSKRNEFTRLLSRREFVELLPTDAKVRGHFWSATFTAYYRKPTAT